ncbi:AGAP013514-PA-like protein [Anopheles sinensis]|uniref:AGAP013514-PA-like protein n=1 Tax=Anopheles sinensis TaxID=74873 RepID=A0A084VVA5_ANOSI|nr:AGAP013514-PA-like protein [Anopheles sinensis]
MADHQQTVPAPPLEPYSAGQPIPIALFRSREPPAGTVFDHHHQQELLPEQPSPLPNGANAINNNNNNNYEFYDPSKAPGSGEGDGGVIVKLETGDTIVEGCLASAAASAPPAGGGGGDGEGSDGVAVLDGASDEGRAGSECGSEELGGQMMTGPDVEAKAEEAEGDESEPEDNKLKSQERERLVQAVQKVFEEYKWTPPPTVTRHFNRVRCGKGFSPQTWEAFHLLWKTQSTVSPCVFASSYFYSADANRFPIRLALDIVSGPMLGNCAFIDDPIPSLHPAPGKGECK